MEYNLDKWEFCREEKKTKRGTKWSEIRKKADSKQMEDVEAQKGSE